MRIVENDENEVDIYEIDMDKKGFEDVIIMMGEEENI